LLGTARKDLVDLLLASGADFARVDGEGHTALSLALGRHDRG
jgi:ankyrin repeat protein